MVFKRPVVYKYFVSYQVESDQGKLFIENTDVHLEKKIDSIQDIWKIEKWLQRNHSWYQNVKIVNYQLMNQSPDFLLTNLY